MLPEKRKPFTALWVEKRGKKDHRQELPDPGLVGFYLVIQPTGAKSWAVRYRYAGRPRKMTIGSYPAFSLADARKAAGAALRAAAEGRDPGAERIEAKSARPDEANVMTKVLDEFLRRHVEPRYSRRAAAEAAGLIKREVLPKWKARRIESIARRDVITLLDGITDRGVGATANRTFSLIRKLMNWSIERGIVETNPCTGLRPPIQETSRDRVLTNDEIRLFWKASESLGWPFASLIRLLLLTGQRREEVAGMSRQELDLQEAAPSWTIPAARAKNGREHFVPLAARAAEMLATIPRIASERQLVFTTTGETSVSGFSRAKANLDEEMLEIACKEAKEAGNDPLKVVIPPWRLHDLRRTAASGMAALGQPVHIVEAVLNHRSGTISGIAAVYNRHDYAVEKRRALDAWDSFVTSLVSEKAKDNVVALRSAS